jgi:hypothetical protein
VRINQRLPFFAFFVVLLFFDAMVGSNSSWGQAPVDGMNVHVSTLKHAPGIPRRDNERLSLNVRRFEYAVGEGIGDSLHLHRHGKLPRNRWRSEIGSASRYR